MTDCNKMREKIEELTAGRAGVPEEDREFHGHIEGCEACRRIYEERRAENRLLDGWDVPEARGNIQARVMAGVAQIERERNMERESAWAAIAAAFTRRFQIPAAVAVGMAAVLIGSVTLNVALISGHRAPHRLAERIAPAPTVAVARTAEETQRIITETVSRNAGALFRPGISDGAAAPLGIILILGAPPLTEPGTQTPKMGI